MKPLFVVFEGIDGSGKGTVISEAKKFLLAKGISEGGILVTCEPTKGYYGKKLREMLSQKTDPNCNARAFLDLYVKDREEHIEKELSPALAQGKIVLCDRYKYSTFVYQSLQGIPLEEIKKLHAEMPIPDLVFVLDLPVETALARIESDSKRKGKEGFEKKGFLEKVRKGFLGLKGIFPRENIVVVDASKEVDDVKKAVCEQLWSRINQ